MRFLVDNQLPPALARFLQTSLNVQAAHVSDVNLRDASDAAIWSYASTNDLILISKDEDFSAMTLQNPPVTLIWVRIGNTRKSVLLEVFRRTWPRILERLMDGERFIEIR